MYKKKWKEGAITRGKEGADKRSDDNRRHVSKRSAWEAANLHGTEKRVVFSKITNLHKLVCKTYKDFHARAPLWQNLWEGLSAHINTLLHTLHASTNQRVFILSLPFFWIFPSCPSRMTIIIDQPEFGKSKSLFRVLGFWVLVGVLDLILNYSFCVVEVVENKAGGEREDELVLDGGFVMPESNAFGHTFRWERDFPGINRILFCYLLLFFSRKRGGRKECFARLCCTSWVACAAVFAFFLHLAVNIYVCFSRNRGKKGHGFVAADVGRFWDLWLSWFRVCPFGLQHEGPVGIGLNGIHTAQFPSMLLHLLLSGIMMLRMIEKMEWSSSTGPITSIRQLNL